MISKDDAIEFIILSKPELIDMINSLIKEKQMHLLNEDIVFHDVIKEQFKDVMAKIIIDQLTNRFAISTEEAIMLIEEVDLEEIFKC